MDGVRQAGELIAVVWLPSPETTIRHGRKPCSRLAAIAPPLTGMDFRSMAAEEVPRTSGTSRGHPGLPRNAVVEELIYAGGLPPTAHRGRRRPVWLPASGDASISSNWPSRAEKSWAGPAANLFLRNHVDPLRVCDARRPGRSTATSCSPGPTSRLTRASPRIWLVSAARSARGGSPAVPGDRAGRSLRRDPPRKQGIGPACRLVVAWLPTRAATAGAINRPLAAIERQLSPARWRGGHCRLPNRLSQGLQRPRGEGMAEAWRPWRRTQVQLATAIPDRRAKGKTLLRSATGPQALGGAQPGIRVCRADGSTMMGVLGEFSPGFPPGGQPRIGRAGAQKGLALPAPTTR